MLFLIGVLGICICVNISAAPLEVNVLPPGEGCYHEGDERDQVHVERFHGDSEGTSVTLAVPNRLAADFENIQPPLTAEEWCAQVIERLYASGDKGAVFDSALLKLLGVGCAQKTDEAKERLLTVEGDDQNQAENALMILIRMYSDEGDLNDELAAAELIHELFKRGNEESQLWISRAIWTFSDSKEFDQALALAQLAFEREPSAETSQYLGDALLAKGDFEEAFEVVSSALKTGNFDTSEEAALRSIRIQSALKSEKISELNADDASYLRSSLGNRGILLNVIIFVVFTVYLAVLTLLTRRRKALTLGWILTSAWIGATLVGASIGLMMNMPIPVGITMSTCILLAISGSKRLNYFSRGEKSWLIQIGWVLTGYVLVTGLSIAYMKGYEWITGAPVESQLVALLLTPETPFQFIGLLFLGGLCIPLVEEICFRGFLYDWLGKRMAIVWAVLISSVLFGLMHGFAFAIPTGIIGAIACLLRIRFKNLCGAVALHALNNSLAIFALYFGWE